MMNKSSFQKNESNTEGTSVYSGRPTDYTYVQLYDLKYSKDQLKKFLLRRDNHWKFRINHVMESLSLIDISGNEVLDLGTSIGTFAFELAQRGYQVTGIDIDEKAIGIASLIAKHHGLSVNYISADASIPDTFDENSFDVIVAEDIFEHLHNDVLERVLSNCYHWLKQGGYIVYQTCPTRFNYIFHVSEWWIPLIPFAWMNDKRFCRIVEAYYRYFVNPWRKLRTGKTYEESILYDAHCNLLTATHLSALFEKVGFWVLKIETQNLYPSCTRQGQQGVGRLIFRNKQYFHRNITGICWKPLL